MLHKSPSINSDHDLYLPCKIIRIVGDTEDEKSSFSLSIAKATNSQKAIKPVDLKANSPEQVRFAQAMREIGVFYQTKRGEVVPSQFRDPHLNSDLVEIGKLCLAAVFQVPGTSRNKPSALYQPKYYDPIFNGNQSQIARLCKELLYYDHYFRTSFQRAFDRENATAPNASVRISFAHNARTICVAFAAFAARYRQGNITDQDLIEKVKLKLSTIDIDGIIDSRGIIALNAKIFSEIVRNLPDNDVVIETESDNQAIITCEKAKFNIAAQSGDDFSYLPAIEREDFITISEFTLKEVVRQTIFSIADNDTNKMMTGELFEIDNDVLRVVSLDGHRISIRKIELKDAYQPRKVIVSGKTLQEISKIIGGEADAEVEISFTKNHIVFEFDRTLVVSRLIEGEYFRIDQMLSSDYETRVHVNKKELLDCIDRATLLIKEGDKKPIIIDIKNESMELKIKSQIGSMDELIFCTKDGKDLMIGFNPKFLIDALRVIEDEEVDLYFMNAKAPCFIKDENQSYIYLILPVNFNASV